MDDLIKVSPKYRYLFQLFTSFLILGFSNIDLFLLNPIFNIFIFVFLVICITSAINFTNFMDGSDGLVAGCMFVFFLIINYKLNSNISIIILLGSLATFIYWNWNPAKIFMGDIGSTFLGVYFIANILQFNDINEILGLLLIASPIFGDALLTIFRRFFNGKNIFKPHRQHLYQRLYLGKLIKRTSSFNLYIAMFNNRNCLHKIKYYLRNRNYLYFFLYNVLSRKKYAVPFEEAINNKLI